MPSESDVSAKKSKSKPCCEQEQVPPNCHEAEAETESHDQLRQRTRFLKRSIYEHFRWPFKAVQIIGYVSFEHGPQYQPQSSQSKETGLTGHCGKFPKCQLAIAHPIFCILVGLGCMAYYWLFGSYFFKKKFSLFYSLESLVIVMLGVAASTWILFLKIYGLIYRRRASAFLCTSIEDIVSGLSTLNVHLHFEDCRRVMDDMRRRSLNMIALYLTIIAGHLFALGFINNIVIAYFDGASFGDLANSAITVLWDLMCYGHVGLSVWVTSYLKLYVSCMQILNLELQIFEMCQYQCQAGKATTNAYDEESPSPSSKATVWPVPNDPEGQERQQQQTRNNTKSNTERQRQRPKTRHLTKNAVEPIELSTFPPIAIAIPPEPKSPMSLSVSAQDDHSWLEAYTKDSMSSERLHKDTKGTKDNKESANNENETRMQYEDTDTDTHAKPPRPIVEQPSEQIEQFEPILKNCIRFYYTIETCMENFNAFFSTVLVLEFLYCIAVVISMSFYLYVVIIENPQPPLVIIQGAVTLLLHVLVLYDYSTAPALMCDETKKVLSKLQVISLRPLSLEMRFMMQILVTKISSSPPQPSPGRFFTINRTLITSIVSALTTHLVILIQFRQEDRRKIKTQ